MYVKRLLLVYGLAYGAEYGRGSCISVRLVRLDRDLLGHIKVGVIETVPASFVVQLGHDLVVSVGRSEGAHLSCPLARAQSCRLVKVVSSALRHEWHLLNGSLLLAFFQIVAKLNLSKEVFENLCEGRFTDVLLGLHKVPFLVLVERDVPLLAKVNQTDQ